MKNVHQGGFSLIEVLITLVVLAVGLVALAKFQGTAIESGSLAKERTVAAHLAQQKLDDLRNYACLTEADADPPLLSPCLTETAAVMGSVIACSATTKARYDCIVNSQIPTFNAGGNRNADFTLTLPAGVNTISHVDYTRAWVVTDWCFPVIAVGESNYPGKKPNVAAETPCPALVVAGLSDFKRVTVTVIWMDQDGVSQNVKLVSIISASDPLYSGRVLE